MKIGRTIRVKTTNTVNKGRRTNREASRTVVVTYKNPLRPTEEKTDPATEKADPSQGPDATHPDALDGV